MLKHHLHYVGEDRDDLTGRIVLIGDSSSHLRLYVIADEPNGVLLVCSLSELETAQREDREPVPSKWSRVDLLAVESA